MNIYQYANRYLMPQLKPAAWKVFCYLIDAPQASYQDILKGTGIGSTATLYSALDQLHEGSYITSTVTGKWEAKSYSVHADIFVLLSKENPADFVSETKETVAEIEKNPPATTTETKKNDENFFSETVVLNRNFNIKPLGEDGETTTAATATSTSTTSHPAVAYWSTTFQQQLSPAFQQALAGCVNLRALELTAADYLEHPKWNPTNQQAVLDRYAKYARASVVQMPAQQSDIAALEAEIAALHAQKAQETDFQARQRLTSTIQEKTQILIRRKDRQAPSRTVAA